MSEEPPHPFDRQHAATYDTEFAKLSPFKDALHIIIRSALARLRDDARILCVGAGTGAELVYLAEQFPGWRFMALDLSEAMLDVCRQKLKDKGLSNRCDFQVGPVSSLEASAPFDAATCILVSQFLKDFEQRRGLFRDIRARLDVGSLLVSADLTCDLRARESAGALEVWGNALAFNGGSAEQIEKMMVAFEKALSVLSEGEVEDLIESAGFERPLRIFQTSLIHGWVARAK